MNIILGIIIFFFGCIIGSFLNVCIFRIPKEESIAFPPSHCSNCKHKLGALDLVPIFSWLFLKGKCRYCKEKVSVQYPIVEGFTGILFLILFWKFGLTFELLKFMSLTAILIVIGMVDFKTQYVYTGTIIIGIIFGIVSIGFEYFINGNIDLINIALGVILPALILWLIVVTTNAMGFGDVEIIFMVGFFLNMKLNLLNLFLSIVIGGIVAIYLMIGKKKSGKDAMAFGPYIAISTYITVLFGNNILNWYFGTFF